MGVVHCTTCAEPIYPGIAHVCPALRAPIAAASSQDHLELKGFFWKIFASLVVGLILQLGGAIWWASRVQATIDGFKDKLTEQQQTIERIDSYFRRPPQP